MILLEVDEGAVAGFVTSLRSPNNIFAGGKVIKLQRAEFVGWP